LEVDSFQYLFSFNGSVQVFDIQLAQFRILLTLSLLFRSRLVSFFLKLDKSGMTYVIFKGTKTASGMCVSLFPAEPRDDNPHLTASSSFSTSQEIEQVLSSRSTSFFL
jgi:hypothetical protein